MRTLHAFVCCVAIAGQSGCNTQGTSTKVSDVVALCSSGIDITSSAKIKLEAELTKILNGPQSASAEAEIKQAIRGIVFNEAILTTQNGVRAFEVYNDCVQKNIKL